MKSVLNSFCSPPGFGSTVTRIAVELVQDAEFEKSSLILGILSHSVCIRTTPTDCVDRTAERHSGNVLLVTIRVHISLACSQELHEDTQARTLVPSLSPIPARKVNGTRPSTGSWLHPSGMVYGCDQSTRADWKLKFTIAVRIGCQGFIRGAYYRSRRYGATRNERHALHSCVLPHAGDSDDCRWVIDK